MTKHLKRHFSEYLIACYGKDWATRIPTDQLAETRKTFYFGALAYMELMQDVLDPISGPTTPAEDARSKKRFIKVSEEIAAFQREHIGELLEF